MNRSERADIIRLAAAHKVRQRIRILFEQSRCQACRTVLSLASHFLPAGGNRLHAITVDQFLAGRYCSVQFCSYVSPNEASRSPSAGCQSVDSPSAVVAVTSRSAAGWPTSWHRDAENAANIVSFGRVLISAATHNSRDSCASSRAIAISLCSPDRSVSKLKIISDRTDQRHVDAVPILIADLRQTVACINHISISVKQLGCRPDLQASLLPLAHSVSPCSSSSAPRS